MMTLRIQCMLFLACLGLASCASKPPPEVPPEERFVSAIPDTAYTSRSKDPEQTSRSAAELEAAGYQKIGVLTYKAMPDKFAEHLFAFAAKRHGADLFVMTEKSPAFAYVNECAEWQTRKSGSYEVGNTRVDTYKTSCTQSITKVPMTAYVADLWRLRRTGPPPCCIVEYVQHTQGKV